MVSPFSALTLLVGGDDAALHVLQLQLSPLATSVILGCNKIHNGNILYWLTWVVLEKQRLNECPR